MTYKTSTCPEQNPFVVPRFHIRLVGFPVEEGSVRTDVSRQTIFIPLNFFPQHNPIFGTGHYLDDGSHAAVVDVWICCC